MTRAELTEAIEFLRSGAIQEPKRDLMRKVATLLCRERSEHNDTYGYLGRVASFVCIRHGVEKAELAKQSSARRLRNAKGEYAYLARLHATVAQAATFVGYSDHTSVCVQAEKYDRETPRDVKDALVAAFKSYSASFTKME